MNISCGNPSRDRPANDQIYNDRKAIQSLLCLLSNQVKKKTNDKMERPVLSLIPCDESHTKQKKLMACLVTLVFTLIFPSILYVGGVPE